MRKLVQDIAAEQDLIDIAVYTYKQWGYKQAEIYLDALESGIKKLQEDPDYGLNRDELRAGYRSIRIRHHIIFYTFNDVEIRIRRVLHEVMDLGRHL